MSPSIIAFRIMNPIIAVVALILFSVSGVEVLALEKIRILVPMIYLMMYVPLYYALAIRNKK